jgi:hypothetical protein
VATKRQIAANRLNASKSTGPRSSAAKKRSSRNAYRHGFTLSLTSSAAFAKRLDNLARKIAGGSKNEIILEHARAAAQAELDLARVRQVKVAFIERASALGALDAPPVFGPLEEMRYLRSILLGRAPPVLPERVDPAATMPTQEPERTAEAVRRALPELVKLDRYESRTVSRRDRAIREIVKRRSIRDRRSGNDEAPKTEDRLAGDS